MGRPDESRYNTLKRPLLLVADLLSGKNHDRRSVAMRLGVKPPAADRQLTAILKHLPGAKVERRGKKRVVVFDLSALAEPPSAETAIAACLGASLSSLFEGSRYELAMREALHDVLRRAPGVRSFKEIGRKFLFVRRGGEMALPDRAHLLDTLVGALLDQQIVSLTYRNFEGDIEGFEIAPLTLAIYDHQVYVIGRRMTDGNLRAYRFSRIDSVEARTKAFAYPDRSAYDPSTIFRDSFGIFFGEGYPIQDIELELSRKWRTYAATHRWHESQTVDVRSDGARVRLRVRSCPELIAWIVGFGPDVRVVAPRSLRDAVAAIHRRAATLRARGLRKRVRRADPKPVVRRRSSA